MYYCIRKERKYIENQIHFSTFFLRIQKFCKKRKRGGEVEQFAIQICVFLREEEESDLK